MSGYAGFQEAATSASELTAQMFLINKLISKIAGAQVVRVMAVTNAGALAAVGFCDVQIMVNQIDASGGAVAHGTIYHLPYFRLQGGTNAVIIDPVVGDIGLAVFADRDISSVKATRKVSNPGSRRQNSHADGIYIGGVLNGLPSQIVRMAGDGITLTSPVALTLNAPTITLNGNVASTGTFMNNGHAVGSTHQHSGVNSGVGNTGVPL